MFYHSKKNVRVVVHGDDFTALGTDSGLDWFRQGMKGRFDLEVRGRLGPEPQDDKQIRILNRVVTWDAQGLWYEPDQRHSEIIIRDLGLKGDSKGVVSPGLKSKDLGDSAVLSDTEATMYRALVARGIYLAQDRSDITFSVKELSRSMSQPTQGDWEKLKRLGRYLIGRQRVAVQFRWQKLPRELSVYVDTDYAGCPRTRKSTSGGLGCFGSHVIKSWSTTQSVVTLSSGESEYYGLVRGSSMGLGLQALGRDLGVGTALKVYSDANAALGIALRRGVGKVRHIEVHQLWLQDKVGRGDLKVEKVDGEKNPADALTKYLDGNKLDFHRDWVHLHILGGRHCLMPEVAQDG